MSDHQEVFEAIQENDVARLKELLAKEPSLAGAKDENGVSALMKARYHFQMEMVEALVAAKPELDIFEAAAMGKRERVKELVRAQPELMRAWSPDGFTALHLAAFLGQPEMVALLLEHGAAVNATARNPMKVMPLHSAVASRKLKSVELLLEHGAEVNAQQQGGWTALHAAAHHGDVETAKVLLAKGADKSRKSADGKTPLDMAEAGGHEEMARLLRGQT
ncbi:MAG: ankyrin repeat domain-containing protein [Acidobacteria bacterium]|nr:ankyrin repeat domain-containing protein [Acidobacteriota bacterium]